MKNHIYLINYLFLFLASCSQQPGEQQNKPTTDQNRESIAVHHAENFSIQTHENFSLVTVNNAWKGSKITFRYALLQKGKELPDSIQVDEVVNVPVENLVCFSTTHVPYLDMLGVGDKLKGFPNLDYISTPGVREQIDAGNIMDLGSENNPNLEKIITLNPDVVMAYGMPGGSDLVFKLQQAGISVVYNADYMELSPLGRAEWIKYMAAFFDKISLADSLYSSINQRYDSLQQLAAMADNTPSVLSGIVYGDTWFLPAGKNYGARFFKDANAHYLWADNPQAGYLELSFEAVYQKAHQADYWVGVGTFNSLTALANADARYRNFQAFQEGSVYSYLARVGPKGGNEYFELGYARPDIILADLIKIFHPALLPNHALYFHEKL